MQLQDVGLYLRTTFHLGHPIVYLTQNIYHSTAVTRCQCPDTAYSILGQRQLATTLAKATDSDFGPAKGPDFRSGIQGTGMTPMPFPCVLLLESGPSCMPLLDSEPVHTTCRLGFDIGVSVITEPVYNYTLIVHQFKISASMHAHLPILGLVRILEGAE